MDKNYDTIVIPTGEEIFGEESFPVSNEAIKLFHSGKFGHIFVTGGYNGFANAIPGITKSEAEATVEHLVKNKIPNNKIYSDSRSLETLGNFTFPLVKPLEGNPNLSEFKKI